MLRHPLWFFFMAQNKFTLEIASHNMKQIKYVIIYGYRKEKSGGARGTLR